MKKMIIGIAIALVMGGAFVACSGGAQRSESTPEPLDSVSEVVVDGKVVPVKSAALSLPTGGVVAEVLVAEGDKVEAGQALLRVDNTKLKAAVAQAEATLQGAQTQLTRLKEGARPEEIAVAEAALTAAEASLQKVLEGPGQDLIVAAQNDLAKLKAGPTAEELKGADLAVEQAKATLWSIQIDRDGICGNPVLPEYQCKAANARVFAAEVAVSVAQNNLAKLKAGPRAEDVATAEARLAKLLEEPSAASVAGARAQVEQAQARLDLLKATARATDIAAAEAEVRTAEAALRQAQAALADTELKAPFAGTVGALSVRVGEQVLLGSPVVQLGDLSSWQWETTDLTELNVVGIKEGSIAKAAFDAIPGLELSGKVVRVKPLGESRQGDIVYTVVIKPDRHDDRLRWNMTALIAIESK